MIRWRVVALWVALASVFVGAFATAGQQPTGKSLLEQARTKKTAGDLQAAMETLESIISNLPADRNVANALLEMGAIADSLGQTSRARTFYERVRNDFSDQTAETKTASERLTAATGGAKGADSSGNPAKISIRTLYTDDVYSFAISPDGRTLVFQGISPEGKRHLWRQAVDASQKPEPIAGTEGAGQNAFPFFSPDSRTLGFFSKQGLWQVDLAGGTPKLLASVPTPNGAAWNGGTILLSGRGVGGPFEVIEDGKVRTAGAATGLFVAPRFLDDQRFLYYSRDRNGGGQLAVGALDGSSVLARGLPQAQAAAFTKGFLVFVSPSGTLNAMPFDPKDLAASGSATLLANRVGKEDRYKGTATFSVSASGAIAYREAATLKKQLLWMDRTGALLGTVGPPDSDSPALPRLSPDGKSVIYFRQLGAALGSEWIVDSNLGNPRILQDFALGALWSTDGSQVLIANVGQTGGQVAIQPAPAAATTTGARAVARGGARGAVRPVNTPGAFAAAFPDDWGQNGYFLYHSGNGTGTGFGGDLYVLPPNQGDPILIAQSPGSERNGRFSPDNNWIVYQTDDSGRNEVYVLPFPATNAKRQQVSLSGGSNPQWGRGGKELYFLSAENRLMVVTAEASVSGEKRSIEFGTPKALFNTPLPPGSEFDVDRNTDRFLFLAPVEDPPSIIVLTNWTPGK